MKRTARSFCLFITFVWLILTVLALPACRSGTSVDIPSGWEEVSRSENVTHIRMKEGKRAYKWADFEDAEWVNLSLNERAHADSEQIFLCVALAGSSEYEKMNYDENATVDLIAYYGYGTLRQTLNGYELTEVSAVSEHAERYQLSVQSSDGDRIAEYALPETFGSTNSVLLDRDDPEAMKIGYTEAVVVRLPMAAFAQTKNDEIDYVEFLLDYAESDPEKPTVSANDLVYSYYSSENESIELSVRQDTLYLQRELSFPRVLTHQPGIVLWSLAGAAVLLLILTARFAWKRFIPYLPCAVGAVYSVIIWCLDRSIWAFLAMLLWIGIYILLSIVMAVVQAIVAACRRKRLAR